LPSDGAVGLSKKEVEANEAEGIASTDAGAWIDEKGRVRFDEEGLRKLPVWKEKVPY
jgi:calcium permeable stress-gated cation channel